MKEIEQEALGVVSRLKEAAENHQRTYPANLDAVLVFSGPGTYYDNLKIDQDEWMRWMDRDRIRAGVAVVREATATTIRDFTGKDVSVGSISKDNISKKGPFLVYNGIPQENEVFRRAIDSQYSKIPKDKVLIIDEVRESDKVVPIAHTAHQVKSFYQELVNPESPLYYARSVAFVSHIPDFVRIPFYLEKYDNEYLTHNELKFYFYGLKSRPETEQVHLDWELPRLVQYAEQGHLSKKPSDFSV